MTTPLGGPTPASPLRGDGASAPSPSIGAFSLDVSSLIQGYPSQGAAVASTDLLKAQGSVAGAGHGEQSGLGRALSRGAEVWTCCLVWSLNGPSAFGAVVVIAASMVRFAVIRTTR